MNHPVPSRSELYLRFSHRSMVAMLFIVAILGVLSLTITIQPGGTISRLMERGSWMIPMAIIVTIAALNATLRGQRWDARSAEARAILQDEWRQQNLHRATRAAFVVTLVAQLLIGLAVALFDATGHVTALSQTRVVLAMAVATITIGMTTLIALFLIFDRTAGHE